jgi:predicted  nucleic acid-binding Zn-ribbon protein
VHPDVAALLAVQTDDAEIHELETRLAGLEPRMLDLERQRQVAADALARARQAVEGEERSHRDLGGRLQQHRQLEARNQAQLDTISNPREAAAAMAQLDASRRLAADVEGMVQTSSGRLADLRDRVRQQEDALAAIEREQESVRTGIAAERRQIEEDLRHARMKRDGAAGRVSRALLAKYDRVRTRKRDRTLVALNGGSCGACDTAIPLQRRNMMQATGAVEMCEECGVLLYAAN